MPKSRMQEIREQVEAYNRKHPEVWEEFVRFSLEKAEGARCRHYSAMGVWQRLRWEFSVGADGESEFKINNNFVPHYARQFMKAYPKYASPAPGEHGFFKLRKLTSEDAVATNLPPLGPGDYPYV